MNKIIYINTIGAKSNKFAKEHFSSWVLFNPRIKESRMGSYTVTKYSFRVLDIKDLKDTVLSIKHDCMYPSDIMCLTENLNNVWLMERTKS